MLQGDWMKHSITCAQAKWFASAMTERLKRSATPFDCRAARAKFQGVGVGDAYEIPENHAHTDVGADRRTAPRSDGADLFRNAHLLRTVARAREPLRRRVAGARCQERRPRRADDVQ